MSEVDYKVILLGNTGVGKTCFFKKLTTGKFMEKTIPTIGLDRKTVNTNFDVDKSGEIENKNFHINLFDTAGQEKYRVISKNYYRRSDGILILYDITNRQSFDDVNKWINEINEYINDKEKCAIILIGNKSDLIENNKREVNEEEAKEICFNHHIIWGGEISIKTIDINELKELFDVYVKKIYEKAGENIVISIPVRLNERHARRHRKAKSCC